MAILHSGPYANTLKTINYRKRYKDDVDESPRNRPMPNKWCLNQ